MRYFLKKSLRVSIAAIALVAFIPLALAATNSHSLDLEASSSQSVSIADASQTGLDITGNQSMCIWVKVESAPSATSYTFMAKYNSANAAVGWTWDYNDNAGTKRLRTVMGNGGGAQTVKTIDADLGTATWKHVCYVYTAAAGTVDIYVDNVNVGQHTGQITSLANTPNTFVIGAILPDAGNYADWLTDDAYLYDKALSTTEIDDLYNRDGDYCTLTTTDANLQGGWYLNNDLTDSSGNGNTLTNNNSAVFSTDVAFAGDPCGGGAASTYRRRINEW